MTDKLAELKLKDPKLSIKLPVYSATLGQDTIDIRTLVDHDFFSYDPGFISTASCESKITFIDGDKGVLLHRGYPIEQLAEKKDFMELCYLLLEGELPTAPQMASFIENIKKHTILNNHVLSVLKAFDKNTHPMSVMLALMSTLAAQFHNEIDINDAKSRQLTAYRLIALMPVLTAATYRNREGFELIAPDPSLNYSKNFLHMFFGEEKKLSKSFEDAIDTIFLLHADHEQNASTSSVRLTGSTGANPFACICSGIAALWGPAHGGANEAVLKMLVEIGDIKRIPSFIKRAKDKNDEFRLMGFGHRVYKSFDPRAQVLKKNCDDVLNELGVDNSPLFSIAKELEKIALEDDYFIEKQLYPNIDFYSGIILKALGIPTEMFTVIFALGRTPGWISHWNEMISSGYRIGRPRQLYVGEKKRDIAS